MSSTLFDTVNINNPYEMKTVRCLFTYKQPTKQSLGKCTPK